MIHAFSHIHGDGIADDTRAIQAMLDREVDKWNGGTVTLGRGRFRTTESLFVRRPCTTIRGEGLGTVPGPCCIICDHDKPAIVLADEGIDPTPFRMVGVSLARLASDRASGSAGLEIWTGTASDTGSYRRRVMIERVGIDKFDYNVLIRPSVGRPLPFWGIGELRIHECSIIGGNHGLWGEYARTDSGEAGIGSVNMLTISNSLISGNKIQGGRIRAYGGVISGCCFEGQPKGLELTGCKGVHVQGCFSECNAHWAMWAHSGRDVVFTANRYTNGVVDEKFVCENLD